MRGYLPLASIAWVIASVVGYGSTASAQSLFRAVPIGRPVEIGRPGPPVGTPVPLGSPYEIGRPGPPVGTPVPPGRPYEIGRPGPPVGTPVPLGRPYEIGRPGPPIGTPAPLGKPYEIGRPGSPVGTPVPLGNPYKIGRPGTIGTPGRIGAPSESQGTNPYARALSGGAGTSASSGGQDNPYARALSARTGGETRTTQSSSHPSQWLINDVLASYGSDPKGLKNIKLVAQNAQYAQLANAAYGEGRLAPPDWVGLSDGNAHDFTGMTAKAYQNTQNGQIVVAFRGTVAAQDWATDGLLAAGVNIAAIPEMQSALGFARKIQQKYGKEHNIVFVGHSLGGAMAQYSAIRLGAKAIAFDPAPLATSLMSGGQLTRLPSEYSEITNFRGSRDPVTGASGILDIGKPAISIPDAPSLSAPDIVATLDLSDMWDGTKYNHSMDNLTLAMRATALVAPSLTGSSSNH